MVELVGAAALHDRDVIHHRGEVRQHRGELRAALAVSGKGILRAEHRRIGPDEGVSLATDHLRGNRLALDGRELGLVVEKIELAWRTRHEELDHGLGPAGGMRGPRLERARGGEGGGLGLAAERFGHEPRQRHLADADAAVAEEMPSRDVE